ncbi:hypothetical protein ABZP36_005686 [Zizania latifolia]
MHVHQESDAVSVRAQLAEKSKKSRVGRRLGFWASGEYGVGCKCCYGCEVLVLMDGSEAGPQAHSMEVDWLQPLGGIDAVRLHCLQDGLVSGGAELQRSRKHRRVTRSFSMG